MTLGELLKKTRKERKLTAKEVIKHTGLKSSVSLFSQWENDLKAPTPLDLRILCQFLGLDLTAAFNLWASAHMPTPTLKRIFQDRIMSDHENGKDIKTDPIAYPAAITLVIHEQDAAWFTKNPDAGTVLVRCLMHTNLHNHGISAEKLAKELKLKASTVLTFARELTTRKYLHQQGNNFQTPPGIKYVYLPETEVFEEMRRSRIQVNLDRTLKNISPKMVFDRRAVRLTVFKKMTIAQAQYFVDSIEALANEMITTPTTNNGEEEQYNQFICVFGPEAQHG